MNSDLAYCLERFIDDQIQLIDDYLETVDKNETAEYLKIEQQKIAYLTENKTQTNKGSHDEDEKIVQRLIQNLLDITDDNNMVSDIEHYQELLRTEFIEKIDDCLKYITRLRNLAGPILGSENFVLKCNEVIDQLRKEQETVENYSGLCERIQQSDSTNVAENIRNWWEEAYGSTITEITHLNKRFNPGIGNNDIAVVLPKSEIIRYAKRILSIDETEPVVGSQKQDLIREFVQHIQSIDDENRQEISEDDLINQLNISDIDFVIDYAVKWLDKRDKNRNHKQEENPYDVLWQETKAEFDCQRIAQEAKKLALATLLRRLAIGSTCTEQFDQKLKDTLEQQKQGNGISVITGDIGEPSVEKLPITIRLEEVNFNEWSTNLNQIQDEFSSSLCEAFLIPDRSIRITGIEYGSVIIIAYVLPPYGKNVIDSLNGSAPDSSIRIKTVRKCCSAVKAKIASITLGECGLSIDHKLMDPMWNRKYLWSYRNDDEGEYWEKSINRGGKPYFCPSGWQRFGIKVAENNQEFDARWGDWYLAYHGTRDTYAVDILTSGLRVSTRGCHYTNGRPRVYLSPSIEYCAHGRYAKPWKKIDKNGETRWFQLIFQCHVNPKAVEKFACETLLRNKYKDRVVIDPNFNNNELEWIIPGREGSYYMNKDIICYALMMRVSDSSPEHLPSSAWWKYC